MKFNDVKAKMPQRYMGYLLQHIWEHDNKPFAWDYCKSLKRIPGKITAFIQKDKIKEVRKSDCFKNPLDNYYLVELIDNTWLELEY